MQVLDSSLKYQCRKVREKKRYSAGALSHSTGPVMGESGRSFLLRWLLAANTSTFKRGLVLRIGTGGR